MKAVRYHSYGETDVLVHEEADKPQPGPGEVLVKVAGAAFNPVDGSIRAGFFPQVFPLVLPHTPSYDVSGTVAEVGAGVTGWTEGDAVVAFLPIAGRGAAAEYAIAPAETLAAAPRVGDLADAAALPSVGLTAWQALFEHVGLKPDQTILINGAGGAVGAYATQLAVRAGAVVTATGSSRSVERLRSYGAQRVIDHTETPLHDAVAGERFDVVLNLVWYPTPDGIARLLDLVVDGGAFANTVPPAPESADRGVRVLQVFARSDAEQLAELVSRVDAGDLAIHVAQRRPLAELRAVHEQAAAGTLPGKTVLVP
ncbi:NADP-dependent oxidoreductase [Actinokineospora terrae]|uniref:NADPH:quinone reductase n=1 Tax=Actinokineospora terrae TaxID=155974 RepID=A0A1H9MMF7_9PSEU|nr:NADP-dependent oxidoreductase [Actinokineospora terrae]SER24731.1 NADPH:quinone reductase [Actinokineospora terrae]